MRAAARERQRERAPDAARPAGHERAAPAQSARSHSHLAALPRLRPGGRPGLTILPTLIYPQSRGELRLNALLVQPAVATARYSTTRSTDTVVYVSSLKRRVTAARLAKGEGTAYDADGRERGAAVSRKGVVLAGGGFTVTS